MQTPEERRAAYGADRKEAARLAEATAAALRRHGLTPEPRPGLAARRANRMLRVDGTRREG